MALRILSGLIFIPRGGTRRGTVTITFDPFVLSAASNPLFELRKEREIGPSGRFSKRPATIVAARQFDILTGTGGDFRGRINDSSTRDSITISWNSSAGRVDQEEIPFMVIGEVPEGPSVSLPPAPGVTVPDSGISTGIDPGAGTTTRGRSRSRTPTGKRRAASPKK
jgi:hypothetical protein